MHRRVVLGWIAALMSTATVMAADETSPADKLQALPDFKIEMVAKADPAHNGSWISLGKDSKGRLYLGAQHGQPMTRITLEDGKVTKSEIIKLPITEVMGQLWVGDTLYVDGSDKNGHFGLYRMSESQGDTAFDKADLICEWRNGGGEHGAHGILMGPDKKLYIVCGNFVDLPADLEPTSPHRNFADDLALPRAEDGNGFGAGKKPPGGAVVRMDLDGKHKELFGAGQRNTYDIGFNPDGELFGFDSDMEWDWGAPWYRPIRVYHIPSAADQGFREGSAKWPEYYFDSLPAAVGIGIGCPTGTVFGTGAKFPAKYQKAFYVLDWTYGRIIATHLMPKGSTYEGSWENLIAPKGMAEKHAATPNNATGIVVGNDGALYFSAGGRGTQGYLYRVTYTGSESTAPVDGHDKEGEDARKLRHSLEAFHGSPDAKAIETAWPQLNSDDRFIRYAARVAIERQPVEQWRSQALSEMKPNASLTSLLALTRCGTKDDQAGVLESLSRLSMMSLSDSQKLDKLRVIEVSIARQGKPTEAACGKIAAELEPMYPAPADSKDRMVLDRELCQVLLAVGAPHGVAKTVELLRGASTLEEQLNYVLALRTITTGWTPELRRAYFGWWVSGRSNVHPDYVTKWFTDAGRDYGDGASMANYIRHLHDDAVKSLTPAEQTDLAELLAVAPVTSAGHAHLPTKTRTLVKEWKMEDLEPALGQVAKGRNFSRGREAFESVQCLACHRFGNEGGAIGPDLTAISSRFARRDILESILLPSKVISEQYADTIIKTKQGEVISGRILEDTPQKIVLRPNALEPQKTVTVKPADVDRKVLSKVSPMPQGLVNTLTQDEVLDLVAYLESAGHKDHPDFAK